MKAKALAVLIPALFIATTALAQPAGEKPTAPAADQGAKNKETMKEATLTTKVKSALAADVGLKTITGIDVDSDKGGVVTLKGKVNSADIKKRAEMVAKKVSGVKSVKNQLTVTKG